MAKITIKQQYEKELQRINKVIEQSIKQGFVWEKSPLPKQTKRITRKQLIKIKKITRRNIYNTAVFIDPISKQVFTGVEGKQIVKYRKEQRRLERQAKKNLTQRKVKTGKVENIAGYRVQNIINDLISEFNQYHVPDYWNSIMKEQRERTINSLILFLESIDISNIETLQTIYRKLENSDISSLQYTIMFDSKDENIASAVFQLYSLFSIKPLSMQQSGAITDVIDSIELL